MDSDWVCGVREGSAGTEIKPSGFKPSPSRKADIVTNGDSAKRTKDDIWSHPNVLAKLDTFGITDFRSPIEINVIGERSGKQGIRFGVAESAAERS